ncbi:MAG: outer membrane beta-barrel protein [Acidobacteriia bacterium]|nr:outer membrane beta-barrel protein [Terriglobia bacterium]
MKSLAVVVCVGLVGAAVVSAQETPKFAFSIGGGFTQGVGNTGAHLDTGWNVRGGVGFNFSSHVGAMLNVGYDHMGINSTTLSNIGVPGGDVQVFSATIDPIVHLNPHGHVDVYVTGGGGLFHRYQEFTQPSVAVTPAFDPFFGFYPATFGVNQILASYSVNKPGVDAGVGIAFGSIAHGKFFAEARYNHIYMANSHMDYLPVTFGFRW